MASSNVTKLDPSSDAFKRILYNLQVRLLQHSRSRIPGCCRASLIRGQCCRLKAFANGMAILSRSRNLLAACNGHGAPPGKRVVCATR